MYSDRIVAVVKVNGQVLRENGDTVTLPFGSEYSLLVKNLNSVRAEFKVSVDGTDATEGIKLFIPANSSVELERFIRNGNLQAGNRFKFIERTAGVEAHRGIGAEDGLIRVEAWREVPCQYVYHPVVIPAPIPAPRDRWEDVFAAAAGPSRSFDEVTQEVPRRGIGITVAGSESHQQFSMAHGFPVEATSTVIVLRLRGEVAGQPVAAAVTVDVKPTCTTCGKTNKAMNKFCAECGTSLRVI